MSAGGSEDTVQSDIGKIHQENVDRLSRLSATEILQEKEQIEMALGKTSSAECAQRLLLLLLLLFLGPDLLAFLKKSGQKQTTSCKEGGGSLPGEKIAPVVQGVQKRGAEVQGMVGTQAKLEGREVVVPPGGWLHMDVLEKEKLEWMTDVPLVSPKTELDKAESRFSLDGLVIPRSTDIPSHLGLHHHGDEPQVRWTI